jgi:transcriptional regulator with XRE-family HTH domain
MPRPAKNQHVVAVLRQAIGLGQEQLADRIGISKSALQKIELNERTLTGDTAKQIADHTGVDLDWLLAGDYRQPPPAIAEGVMTREKYDRHRAWVEWDKPLTDAQWEHFQQFAVGATIGLAGGKRPLPDDPVKLRRQAESAMAQELTLEVRRKGRKVPLPKGLRGLERSIVKRMQTDQRRAMRRGKVAELKEEFEALIKAVFQHKDGDFLVWQLKERLAEFRSQSGLAPEPGQKA